MVEPLECVRIEMLGRFRVVVGGRDLAEQGWPSRRAGELVALLALSDGHRLPRDRAIDCLWPHLDADAGAANLRKAAHHARRALADPAAVVLRAGFVELYPERPVSVDVESFLRDAEAALADGGPDACARAAAQCTGEVLPDHPYEAWAQDPRRLVRERRVELLRGSSQWGLLAELEPTDEPACREVMRAAIDTGRRHVAIRSYERLRVALARELGLRPAPETTAIYESCTAELGAGAAVFVGRESELALATAHLGSVQANGPATLLVRGPSGIGKSAFCREVAARARAGGSRVIAVTATGSGRPYAPLGAVVEQLTTGERATVDRLPPRTRSILQRLTGAESAPAAGAPAVTRHQVVAAVQRALEATAQRGPTVLWVDDAHLLDAASSDALHQLVAGGSGTVFLMLACRAEWIRTSLPPDVVALSRAARTLLLDLGPLGGDAIGELVRRAAPLRPADETVDRIVELADGNAFFAIELARAAHAGPAEALPATIRQAVLRQLAGVDTETTDALAALAIADGALDLPAVLALTGLSEADAFVLLDAGLDTGILVVSGARYRFRHELVRQALSDELPAHRRQRLHREAAERLAATGAPAELIADHWLKGQRPREAIGWLMTAARRAVGVAAYADALTRVERVLAEAPDRPDALCLRAEILDALGDPRAPDAYAKAADAAGEPEAQDLKARQALAQLKASDPDSALRTLEGVRARSTAGRLAEALTFSAAAAIGRYADAEKAAAKAREAHRLAVELGEPGAILDASWAYALAAHANGELPVRLREYLHATHELPELATRVFDGQLCVTERMLYGGLPNDEIIAFADALAAEAQRIGAARGEAFAVTLRGEAEILAGDLDAADRDFAAGARLHGRIGAVAGEALSLLGRAQVAVRRGRRAHAAPFLADALVMARESEVGHHTLDRIYGAMVEAADPGLDVVCEAEAAIQGPAETCPTCRIAFIVPATIAAARGDDLDRAHRYARACDRALEIVALPPAWHAAVDEAHGWVSRAAGQPDAARRRFDRAAEGFAAWGQPLDEQRCRRLARASGTFREHRSATLREAARRRAAKALHQPLPRRLRCVPSHARTCPSQSLTARSRSECSTRTA
jgi:DNA-binding SARP family transcriptional activator/tetratricopeptide (TPR) repeat protein